ncbi:HK97-gp10 family putative phage morphogenesis protein [Vibrio fortis]|uniref:HK97-gp10 family putative phage morphogenesis protein n=1 Tax=Vibrio fortis TaxID=212667 RepID=UPI0038CD43E0
MISFSLDGFNDLNDMLADMQSVLGKPAVRKAARAAMTPVLRDIEATAPYDALTDDGLHLREHFKLTVSGRKKTDTKKGNDTFLTARVQTSNKEVEQYAALVEFGRASFTTQKTNAYGIETKPFNVSVKATQANPFMRPAMNKNYEHIVNTFCSSLHDEITKSQSKRSKTAKSKIKCMERKAKKRANE